MLGHELSRLDCRKCSIRDRRAVPTPVWHVLVFQLAPTSLAANTHLESCNVIAGVSDVYGDLGWSRHPIRSQTTLDAGTHRTTGGFGVLVHNILGRIR